MGPSRRNRSWDHSGQVGRGMSWDRPGCNTWLSEGHTFALKTGGRPCGVRCCRYLPAEQGQVLVGLVVSRVPPDGAGARSALRCSNSDVVLLQAGLVLAQGLALVPGPLVRQACRFVTPGVRSVHSGA